MNNRLKVLSIYNITDDPIQNDRIALAPETIKMVSSRDIRKNDRDVKQTSIYFNDGEVFNVIISGLDLMTLEEVVAGYCDDF